jgi:RNA polymerase sigma factor (sigma-70 family)
VVPCRRVASDGSLTGVPMGWPQRFLPDLECPPAHDRENYSETTASHPGDPGRLPGMRRQPFEAIVARHGPTVLRVYRAVLGPVEADDAWSETFLAALTAYPELPDDANVEAWLMTIAHRRAIDVTRAAAHRAIPVAEAPEPPSAQRTDERDLDLSAALAALPRKQREAVAYHSLARLPYQDVTAVIGGTTDAARRSAADSIANLRRRYPGPIVLKGRTR